MTKVLKKVGNRINFEVIRARHRLVGRPLENIIGRKTAGDSHFISVMVVIIIVLVIAVMFRENMMSIFSDFFTKTKTQINGLFPT